MTNRDVAILAFKLLGLWLMASAAIGVAGIPYYWEPHFEGVRAIAVFTAVLPALIAVGIGVPVWLSADWFAERIFPPGTSESPRHDPCRGQPILAVAFSIMGVFFVCDALPVLLNGLALFGQSRIGGTPLLGPDADRQTLLWGATAKAGFAGAVARLLIGAGLIMGPARLAALIGSIRKEFGGSLADEVAADRRNIPPSDQPREH